MGLDENGEFFVENGLVLEEEEMDMLGDEGDVLKGVGVDVDNGWGIGCKFLNSVWNMWCVVCVLGFLLCFIFDEVLGFFEICFFDFNFFCV